jgi:hypothetical protein
VEGAASCPESLADRWHTQWEEALAVWSRFTRLSPPTLCRDEAEEQREGLTASFAMIRLRDHAVVIALRQIESRGLQRFAVPILAHEIGHHVYAPGDLADHARLLARIRVGLPTRENLAGYVANLYTDLLINDRLQRGAALDMAGVYRALREEPVDGLWALYLRIYETLWSLPFGTLGAAAVDARTRTDAALGARLIRAYARDWVKGGGRFAALCLPYLMEAGEEELQRLAAWFDTRDAGAGGEAPDGLTELDDDEGSGAIHPAEDPDLTGLGGPAEPEDGPGDGTGRAIRGGRKHNYRDPLRYVELMRSAGVELSEDELVLRYYRERARPHLIRFPVRMSRLAADPLPEGVETWEPGSPLEDIDWTETAARSPVVVPGVTTVQRVFGTSEGAQPERIPLDLYLGVDCSGSMQNPRYAVSYPVLGAVIMALSALRAGARVRAVLSGEPGSHSSTDGFERREREILKVLTGYLGTGYAFGVLRLQEDLLDAPPPKRPVHLMVVTDSDIFHMLGEVKTGWEIAERALRAAGGGGTLVLHMNGPQGREAPIERLRGFGWDVRFVASWEDLVAFARAFSRATWGRDEAARGPRA